MKIAILHMTMGLVDRGSEISTDLIARLLSRRHKVTVIQSGPVNKKPYQTVRAYPHTSPPPVAPRNILDKVLFRIGLDSNSKAVGEFTRQALPFLEQLQPDIIIATNGAGQVKILKKGTSAIIVVFGRAGIGHHDRANLMARPNLFIALSSPAKKWANQIAKSPTKVVYIPNPIDIQNFRNAKSKTIGLKSPVAITVGAFTKYKNIDSVIRAVSFTNYSLLIVGKGEEESQLRSLATVLLKGRHKFITDAKPSDLPSLYAATDLFIFTPDEQESFGRVYLEAMAANLPIIASDDPIRRDIIGKQGYYSRARNVEELSNRIKSIRERQVVYSNISKYDLMSVAKLIEKEFDVYK